MNPSAENVLDLRLRELSLKERILIVWEILRGRPVLVPLQSKVDVGLRRMKWVSL